MIESYFFIPASHPKLSEKVISIPADHVIIDLEDAIREEDIVESFHRIGQLSHVDRLFVRPALFRGGKTDLDLLTKLIDLGFRKFILPKFRNIEQLVQVENQILPEQLKHFCFILVVENPESLFNLNDILLNIRIPVSAIGFGSQDYCTETGMKHTKENLMQPRFLISGIAKSQNIKAIDIACMEIKERQVILNEIQDAFEMGFEGKFLIHPIQLELLKSFPFFSGKEINHAKEALKQFENKGRPAVFSFKGKAIEPPHIKNYLRIIKWAESHGKQ